MALQGHGWSAGSRKKEGDYPSFFRFAAPFVD
jgi:hypothetical protein